MKTAQVQEYKFEVARFSVAGVQFGDYQKMNLKVGDKLDMFGEPGNKFDPQAISLRQGAWRLGYVPRRSPETFLLWDLHKKGFKMKAYIVANNTNNPTWAMFTVKVCTSEDSEAKSKLVKF